MAWIRRHWFLIVATGFLIEAVRGVYWIIRVGGDIDFVVERSRDLGWIGTVINWLINPPNWTIVPLIACGLLLIWLDVKRPWQSQPIASPPPHEQRIPVTSLRNMAITNGWNGDIQAVAVGDNNFWTFGKRLRQAAADGEIKFFGVRYQYDTSEDINSDPLVEIPRSHFAEYGFDVVQLADAKNWDIFTYKLGESRSESRGKCYRNLHVDEAQARAWLAGKGVPTSQTAFHVKLSSTGAQIGDYDVICGVTLTNVSGKELNRCLVSLEQVTGSIPSGMPVPLVLRTNGQIEGNRTGRFTLSNAQPKTVPILFARRQRRQDWWFFDENGNKYPFTAQPTKLLLGVYSEHASGKFLVSLTVDDSGRVYPTIQSIAEDESERAEWVQREYR